ncbi:MAG: HIT family protein [Hyphomonadaceae bacterium]
MPLHAPYDPENIFAKMLRGDIPAVKVYEDDTVLAFMDIFPQSRGHTLVIPKHVEARNLLDMPTDKIAAYMERVQKLARAVESALKPDGLIITQFNGAPAGQTVFHLHMHLIPVYEDEQRKRGHGTGKQADPAELTALANAIAAAV